MLSGMLLIWRECWWPCRDHILQCVLHSQIWFGSVLTLAELPVFVLKSFVKFDKAPTIFNEVLTKPHHGLIEILL